MSQDEQNSLEALVRMNQSMPRIAGDDPRGAVFVLRADLVSPEIRGLLQACARAVLYGSRGSLTEQIKRARDLNPASAPSTPRPVAGRGARNAVAAPRTGVLQRSRRVQRRTAANM